MLELLHFSINNKKIKLFQQILIKIYDFFKKKYLIQI